MKLQVISQIKIFLVILTLYFIFLGLITAIYGYYNSFYLINGMHLGFMDLPMFILTHLGDSMILTSLIAIIFIKKNPAAVINVIIAVVFTGVFGQILKEFVFEGWDRPLRVFNESPLVHTLPYYRLFHNSFPSGHSLTVITAFTALIWSIKPGKAFQTIAALVTIIVSLSRVYLGVHFPGDVLAGCLIGISVTLLLLPYLNRITIRLNYGRLFKQLIISFSILFIVIGIWLLRVFFPLI